MRVPVQTNDTAATLAARYTVGGPAYGPALVEVNAWYDAGLQLIGPNVPLSSIGIIGAEIPDDWLISAAQGRAAPEALPGESGLNRTIAGVPAWAWLAGIAAALFLR